MSEHTPGPWLAARNQSYWEIIPKNKRENDPFAIGDVCPSDPENPDSGLQEANARLIAAAPEMLEALEAALRRFKANRIYGPERNLLEAVIKKAREE
jgi:hypothetical protein